MKLVSQLLRRLFKAEQEEGGDANACGTERHVESGDQQHDAGDRNQEGLMAEEKPEEKKDDKPKPHGGDPRWKDEPPAEGEKPAEDKPADEKTSY